MGLENIYQKCHRGLVSPSNSRVVAYYVGTLMDFVNQRGSFASVESEAARQGD